jgi:soluble lytic murein transglycosylase-like protein
MAKQTKPAAGGRPILWLLAAIALLTLLVAADPDAGAADPSGDLPSWTPDTVLHWREPILEAGRSHGVSPALIAILMLIESGGNPHAQSGQGALGLMQVMPATAQSIARARGIGEPALFEPLSNLDFGAWYLAEQVRAFGSPGLAAAAYNGGPGTVMAWQSGALLPDESQRARYFVSGMWRERHAPVSPTYEDWLARYGSGLLADARTALGR